MGQINYILAVYLDGYGRLNPFPHEVGAYIIPVPLFSFNGQQAFVC